MKILVADDSITFLNLISSSLTKLGHDVIQTNSGEEALAAFKNQQPDLVILDVVMGTTGGFDCARKMRLIKPDDWIPIIFLSSSVNDESIAKGIEAGGDDYLTKPYSDITLEAKIKAMQRISEMRQQLLFKSDELRRLSSTDALTGLFNRFQFEKMLKKIMAAALRHHYKIALLFVDLDHFKAVNDTFGHGIGDLLIKDVASRLTKSTRIDDVIARIGGDEFVVILNQIPNFETAGEVSQKIIDSIGNEDFNLDGKQIKITASIGIACYPDKKCNTATIIQNADIAMYAAKELGRNNFQFYTHELSIKYKHQLGLEHELKFAIDRNELSVVYQPIYNLLNKKIIGAEALLRWRHPEYGSISPNVFIPIAEESGLIIDIGHWVLWQACTQGKKWVTDNNEFIISINVSIQQLVHDHFMDKLFEVIHNTKIPPKNIELELTEGTIITYSKQLKETLQQLYNIGIRLSIDDFGTRYSTLTSLRKLPITTLKIDKEFVKHVEADKKNAIIVKSMIGLAKT